MKRLDFTTKEVEQLEPTLEGLEFKIVGIVDELEYYDWHQHEEDYRKNEKRFFSHPTEKIEVKIALVVEGIDNCLIKLSRCCSPLPGDDVIGFITRGHGVSVHKRDCNNVPRDISTAEEPERWVNAYWAETKQESFKATLLINGIDRNGLLADVTIVIAGVNVPMHNVNARQTKGGNCIITVTLSVQSAEHLRSIIQRLEKIDGVYHVERSNM